MANAQANVVSTAYVVEVTPGTTPSAALTYLRCNNPDFNANVSTTTSRELRSDRNVTDLVRTSATSEGSIGFELTAVEYEPFIESALGGTFSTAINMSAITISASSVDNSINDSAAGFSTANILPGHFIRIGGFTDSANNGIAKVVSVTTSKIVVSRLTLVTEAAGPTVTVKGKSVRNGATKKTFTIERHFSDLTTTFQSHVGMLVNQMTLNVASEAIVEGSFSFMGRATQFTTSTVGTGTANAATSNPIMSAVANVGAIYENDTLVSDVFFKSINLTTNNNARSLTAISNLYPVDINMGTFDAEFAVESYFSNKTLLEKYLNGTVTELSYSLTDDDGATIVVDAPQIKFSAGSLTGVTLNSDVMQSLTAKALYDATLGYTLQVSYLPA
jgi:hypothetical protein